MANTITRNIANKIHEAKYFSLIADEVTYVSNRDQVVVFMHWIDGELEPHEDHVIWDCTKWIIFRLIQSLL